MPGVVNIRVRGGRRETQARFAALESRWKQEVTPHLEAASVSDLEGLSAKIHEAQRVDAGIQQRDIELGSLQRQIAAQSGVDASSRTVGRASRPAGGHGGAADERPDADPHRAADQGAVQPYLDAVRAPLTVQFGERRDQLVGEPAGLAVSAARLGDPRERGVGGGGELFAAKQLPDVAAQVDTSAD